jgi:predicted SnoaL-like aldol condensation-catalyzing enzyme
MINIKQEWVKASREMFAQFFTRIYKEIPNVRACRIFQS